MFEGADDFLKQNFDNWVTPVSVGLLVLMVLRPTLRSTILFYFKNVFFILFLAAICTGGSLLTIFYGFDCRGMLVYAVLLAPCSWLIGVKWHIRGDKNVIPDRQPCVFVCNHQSMLDVAGMLHLWLKKSLSVGVVAKNMLFYTPIGLGIYFGGSIFVKRATRSEKAIELFNEAAGTLFKAKAKLWVFVEGTRNKHPERLMTFKKGAFRAAIQHQVPIQPVVISPYYFVDWKTKVFGSGDVIIEVMEPIETKGLTVDDLDKLIEKVYALMSAKNDELRKEMIKK